MAAVFATRRCLRRISSTVLEAYENRGISAATAAPAAEHVVEPAADADAKPKRRTRKKATAEV
jgi:hypothetical protein